jgi:hypothetical protein
MNRNLKSIELSADTLSLGNNAHSLKLDRSNYGNLSDCERGTRLLGQEITIVVVPTARCNGRYEARLGEKGQRLCVSTQPFPDSARRLIDLGFDPSINMVMRHAGSETDCLHATIGDAAALTAQDTKFAPEFRRWKPISTPAVRRRIAS